MLTEIDNILLNSSTEPPQLNSSGLSRKSFSAIIDELIKENVEKRIDMLIKSADRMGYEDENGKNPVGRSERASGRDFESYSIHRT